MVPSGHCPLSTQLPPLGPKLALNYLKTICLQELEKQWNQQSASMVSNTFGSNSVGSKGWDHLLWYCMGWTSEWYLWTIGLSKKSEFYNDIAVVVPTILNACITSQAPQTTHHLNTVQCVKAGSHVTGAALSFMSKGWTEKITALYLPNPIRFITM